MRKIGVSLLFFLSLLVYPQPGVQDVLPKTPSVENFERYGNIPVSDYTGQPNVSIPIYTINYGDLNIPLQFTYSSNGVKVNEEASEVGLGWYFNTGTVTQTVNGKDDLISGMDIEIPDFFYDNEPKYLLSRRYPTSLLVEDSEPEYYTIHNPKRLNTSLEKGFSDDKYYVARLRNEYDNRDKTYFPYKGEVFYNFHHHLANPIYHFGHESIYNTQKKDMEMDFFNASFFGHQLTFYYNGGGCYVLNKKNYDISIKRSSEESHYIKIKTPDGITYVFEEELETKYSADSNTPSLYSDYESSSGTKNHYGSYGVGNELLFNRIKNASSRMWKVTEIIDVKGNSIQFNYEILPMLKSRFKEQGRVDFVRVSAQPLRNIYDATPVNVPYHSRKSSVFGPSFHGGKQDPNQHYKIGKSINGILGQYAWYMQEKSVLSSISYGTNRVRFLSSFREDLPNDKKIDEIIVEENRNSNQWELIKDIELQQSYFNSHIADPLYKRLKLDEIVIGDKRYEFQYNSEPLPAKNDNSFDYWGYYNGYQSRTVFSNPFRLLDNKSSLPSWGNELEQQIIGVDNRSAQLDYCKAGILEKVIYPTGGFTQFDYELNTFDNYIFPNFDNRVYDNGVYINYEQTQSQGYGLRLKEVMDSPDGLTFNKKKYSYQGGKQINALNKDLYNIGYISEYAFHPENLTPYSVMVDARFGSRISSNSNLIYQTNIMGNGSYVGYDHVTIEELGANNISKGMTQLYYSNTPDIPSFDKFGKVHQPEFKVYLKLFGSSFRGADLDNGSLLKKEVFDVSGALLLKEENDYEVLKHRASTSYPYTVKSARLPGSYWFVQGTAPTNSIENGVNEYLFFFYPLKGLETKLKTKKITEYFPSGSISSQTSYTYDSNNQLIQEETLAGENKSLKRYKYFYNDSNSSTNVLFYDNRYSEIVGTEEQSNSNRKVTTINYKKDASTHNIALPTTVKTRINNQPIETDIEYKKYDSKGNVQEYQTKDGKTTILIWGYNQTLPIAKIENASYEAVDAKLGIYGLQIAIAFEYHLSIINTLREHLPEAMVTTYTHKPLIGVETITDPRGQTTTYSYDSNNRLKEIRDHQGRLVQDYQYNYKQ